jgi:RNA polymerase sigma-70 factor (ECF subfamily)
MSDEQRFEWLYDEHVHAIAGYLRARADRESAVDALARTFEIAWRRLADVPDEPKAWLFGVARRVLSDQHRSMGRQEALIERLGSTLRDAGEDHAETLGARQALLAALSDLAPVQREVLLLIAWDGLSHREAAAVLGCSSGALTVRLHRARRRLRVVMAQYDLEHLDCSSAPEPADSLNRSPKEAL